jgi:hypothetical protein
MRKGLAVVGIAAAAVVLGSTVYAFANAPTNGGMESPHH